MRLKVLRGWPRFSNRSTLFAAFGLASAVALVAGCASELEDPDAYLAAQGGAGPGAGGNTGTITGGTPATPTGGTVGGPTGGASATGGAAATGGSASTPPPALPACVTPALMNATCTTCHAPATKDFFGGLDLAGSTVTERLLNVTAKNTMATNAATCGTKLIDPDNPGQSVLLKRISGNSDCGPGMPGASGVTGADLECLKNWIMSF